MQVLTTSTATQYLKFTTRSTVTTSDIILLYCEDKNTSEVITIDSVDVSSYYTQIGALFTLTENYNYTFKICTNNTSSVLQANDYTNILTSTNDTIDLTGSNTTITVKHFGKIFCTNQTTYSLNDNEYISKNTTSEFIYI